MLKKQSVRVTECLNQIPLNEYSTQNQTTQLNTGGTNTGEDNGHDSIALDWINKKIVKKLILVFALLSFISVCANTPATLFRYPFMIYFILTIDTISSLLFSAEMITKISKKGLYKNENSYIFDRWCQFDFIMVLFHWISIFLQVIELSYEKKASYLSLLRCPRPLILIRVIRGFLKFRLPKNRINSILQRSSSQIYNVTIFFLFFMALYGILGVQFFGELTSHCVDNNTDPNKVYLNNLMIPDTYCTNLGPNNGYQCPTGMKCIELKNIKREDRGFNGFDEIGTSIFTVYEAASQEGWVFLMYRATDSLPSWRAFFYFITMIFFLAWLVKNVFIAVIIETFAEIRVQFQQMWGARIQGTELEETEVFERKENGVLKLVIKDEQKSHGIAPQIFVRILNSSWFNITVMILVLANAVITATIKHTHKELIDKNNLQTYYYIEIGFTILFNLECLYKIFCLSFKSYIKRFVYKFELALAIGTSLRLIPIFYRTELTYFQVLRIVRLIKSSPLLEDFVNKIFGPGKKLGSLIIFTMFLLIITSCVSMQLFCFLSSNKYKKFETFDQAFMSQFAIMTNEGWTDLMFEVMREAVDDFYLYTYFIPIYFIFCHMFCSLIVLSLFVAVILDNLELDEDVKKIKQLKMREQSAEIQEQLPWRLRIFQTFPNHPQLVTLKRIPNEFEMPKIRETFLKNFINEDYCKGFESLHDIGKKFSLDSDSIKRDLSSAKFMTVPSMRKGQYQLEVDDPSINMIRKRKPQMVKTQINCQIKVLNNLKIQRSNRYNMKKIVLNNIIMNSNNQRLMLTEANGAQSSYITTFTDMKMNSKLANNRTRNTYNMMNGGASQKDSIKKNNPRNVQNSMLNAGTDIDFKMFHLKKQEAELKRNQLEDELKENHPYFDKPLFLISQNSNLRKFCKIITEAKYEKFAPKSDSNQPSNTVIKNQYKNFHRFIGLVSYLDWIMIFVIITSCISIIFESPTNRIREIWQLQVAEYMFVIFMSIEIFLKVCANGFVFTSNAYIKDFAGILDMFIFITGLIFLLVMPNEIPANSGAQILMLLRCLRPLRIFTLVPHMRKVIDELCRGFKEILLVSILLVVLIFIFANYGIQIYGGKLARCNDMKIIDKKECKGLYRRSLYVSKLKLPVHPNKTLPSVWVSRVWSNPYNFDFDTISNSMLALFEVLSLEGWLEVRDVIIDRLGTRHAIFVHLFVFIGTLIGLTLFVGVVITNYSENKGTALLTVDQRRWLDLKGRIKLAQPLHIPPKPENSKFRAFMFEVTQRKSFKRLSAILVLLNCSLLSIPWKEDNEITKILAAFAVIFTILFLIEALMKMIALGAFGYWQSRRNRFDLFVTFLGLFWILFHFISLGKTDLQSTSNSFGFIVIVLRFFTIAGKHATLKMLMLTIIVSFFKSFFIIIGMLLLMLVYAFAGVILFGCVKSGHDLGRHANFKSATNAMVLLMRIVTGEDWNKIMHDCMIAPPACTKGKNYWDSDCGNFPAALLYFCSFYIIITYIVLNLLVAIIMENFSLFYSNEEDALLSYNDIRHFQIVWNYVDTNRKGVIPCKRVKFLLRLLRGRLEVDLERDRLLFKHMCYEIEKLNNGGDVTFHDVLNLLSYRSVDIRKSLKLEELLVREELEYQIEEEVAKQTIRNWLNKCLKRHREKDQTNIIKNLQKQNDIAIFKEQYINRQHLLTQQIGAVPAVASVNGSNFEKSSKNNSPKQQIPSSTSQMIGLTIDSITKNDEKLLTKRLSSTENSNENINSSSCRLSTPDVSSLKFDSSFKKKVDRSKSDDAAAELYNNNNNNNRHLKLIQESQKDSTKLKNWWNNILNNSSKTNEEDSEDYYYSYYESD